MSYVKSKLPTETDDVYLVIVAEALKVKTAESYTFVDNLPTDTAYKTSIKDQQHLHAALLNSLCGVIQLNLQIFMPILDPVEKNRLKKEYIDEDMNHLGHLAAAYDFMKFTMNYTGLGEEILEPIRSKRNHMSTRYIRLSEKVALRPSESLYKELSRDVEHFLRTCCQPAALYDLISFAERHILISDNVKPVDDLNVHRQRINECLQRIDSWCSNAAQFQYHRLKKYKMYYRDFTTPIDCAISQLKYGMTGLRYCLTKSRDSVFGNISDRDDVEQLLFNLIEFPSVNGLNVLPCQIAAQPSQFNVVNVLSKLTEKADAMYLT